MLEQLNEAMVKAIVETIPLEITNVNEEIRHLEGEERLLDN